MLIATHATRIPVFMYLTDYREYCLRDVITQLEPDLFCKVTGLTIPDFELFISLNVFNAALMNDAVYKFKRYKDSSLSYTGIEASDMSAVGLYDTVIYKTTRQEISIEKSVKQEHTVVIDKGERPFAGKQVGDKVFHKTFGKGTILSIDGKDIICRFEGNREKKFFYPQVFEQGYLE